MGDRANVYVKGYNDGPGVYLYTHSGGTELPQTVQAALAKRMRWDDHPYLTRIIFCEMVRDAYSDETGYGISAEVADGDDRIIVVDPDTQTIWRDGNEGSKMTFDDYVALDSPDWNFGWHTFSIDRFHGHGGNGEPMTDEQRNALFATFSRVFDDLDQETRHNFTAAVLGPDAPLSWKRNSGLTAAQASRLLDVLKFMEEG